MANWVPFAATAAITLLLSGCAGLPVDVERTPSTAFAGGADTPIGRALAGRLAAHPGLAGVVPLADGHEAFAARAVLARGAARSLDVQVYLWHGDKTGMALFDEALRAAARGVRVRLLIDDNGTAGLDPTLAMLDAHPNIELRLFNPFALRGFRALGYATEFSRLNRRMHNKSFTVDGAVTVVGGRNIGDAYFAAGQAASFADLDLIVVGEPVREVGATFDRYWNATPSYPAAALLTGVTPMTADAFAARLAQDREQPEAAEYARALAATPLLRDLLAGTVDWEWTTARLFADDPEKVTRPVGTPEVLMLPRLVAALGKPRRTVDLVSPYFVPGDAGTEALTAIVSSGVRVRVLTNSLAATDVAAVHSGYAKRREALLRGGVELFELRPRVARLAGASGVDPAGKPGLDPAGESRADPAGKSAGKSNAAPAAADHTGFAGSSRASLHAKTFGIDGERLFVGSFNFDPRSAALNTEMGFVVDSAALATRLSTALDALALRNTWRVRLDADGRVVWDDGETEPLREEPGVGLLRRALVRVLSWLPIEWML